MNVYTLSRCMKGWGRLRLYSTIKGDRNLLNLFDRGLIQEVFPGDDIHKASAFFREKPRTVYAGFDPTASSLHVGNLLILTALLHAQRGQHNVLALIGGATGLIGDPSGKDKERIEIEAETMKTNTKGIEENILRIFKNHKEHFFNEEVTLKPPIILNNLEWYINMSAVDFMVKAGRYTRVCRMLSRQTVKTRLENDKLGFNFAEFSYQVFQAYDWLYLLQKYDCRVQIGGSDQMGNIYSGHELISRYFKGSEAAYAITLPLLSTESGVKFGKSEGNAIWLSEDLTSPFDLYQYFIRLTDYQAKKLIPLFTFRPMKEVRDLIESNVVRKVQTALANDVTLLVHGSRGLKNAITTSKILYEDDIPSLSKIDPIEIKTIFKQAPYFRFLYETGITILDLAIRMRCFKNDADAIRVISGGGFYVNHSRKSNIDEIILLGHHILNNNISLVRIGKQRYYIIEWTI